MASRTSTPRTRSPSTSSDSSDTTMLDAPTHVALTPTRPRQMSLTHSAPTHAPAADPAFSLLLSLPRELRDRVYAFALTSPYPFWWPGQAPMKHRVAVGLLQANKQVYDEAAPVLYTGNKFLFTHPSDCNIFRVIASPHAASMTSVYFRIREKDLRLWTAYLGSKSADRSLKADLPKLKHLWIFMRCGNPGTPRLLSTLGLTPGANPLAAAANLPPAMAVHVQAVQNALGQQVAALQQQIQNLTHTGGAPIIVPAGAAIGHHHPQNPTAADNTNNNNNNNNDTNNNSTNNNNTNTPPPPPPPPAIPFATFAAGALPHHHHHAPAPPQPGPQNHHILATFLRFERELGIESLCLSLRETLHDGDAAAGQGMGSGHGQGYGAAAGGHRERRREERERRALEHSTSASASASTAPSTASTLASASNSRPAAPTTTTAPEESKSHPQVKIVCIMRVPKPEVSRLVRMYPEELSVDRNGDARTRFRRLHGADICVEVSGVEGVVG